MSGDRDSSSQLEYDAGAPLPDFSNARNISLTTVAPALGVQNSRNTTPDYLEFDQKGRGVVVTMFANAGMCYLVGIGGGGLYGLQRGIVSTPSSKFKVKLNSVLNHSGRHGSRVGNTLGVFAVMYSLYEGLGDALDLDRYTGNSVDVPVSPIVAAGLTGMTYYGPAGIRVASLGGIIGCGIVSATYTTYKFILGKPYGSYGFLWF